MKIHLKDVKNSEMFETLAQHDTKRDGVLDDSDLQLTLGRETASEFSGQIQEYIEQALPHAQSLSEKQIRDWQIGFYRLWSSATTKRDQVIERKMRERLKPDLEELSETGYRIEDFFNAGSSRRLSDRDSEERALPLLAEAAIAVLKEDFGYEVEGNFERTMFRSGYGLRLNVSWIGSVAHYRVDSPPHLKGVSSQHEYARLLPHELNPSAMVTAFEVEFGIPLLIKGQKAPNDDVISMIAGALADIRAKRPDDFERFKKDYSAIYVETNEYGEFNGRVERERGYLTLEIPSSLDLSPSKQELKSHWRTGEELALFQGQRYREALEGIVLHEFGHVVGGFEPTRAWGHEGIGLVATGVDGLMSVPEDYLDILIPHIKLDQPIVEGFAQDYRIFLQSGGTRVMEKNFEGEAVPAYEARLEFFQDEYPLE